MKKFIIWLLVLSVGGYALVRQYPTIINNPRSLLYYSPCDTPLTYKIGFIDPRFGISATQLVTNLHEAESVWESPSEKNLFQDNPQALLTVQMQYDTRQALVQKIDALDQNRNSLGQKIDALDGKISQDQATLQAQKAELDRKVAIFKKDSDAFNQKLDAWNAKGGRGTKDEYDSLKTEQANLQIRFEELSKLTTSLNLSSKEFNSQVATFNSVAKEFNSQTKNIVSTEQAFNQELQVRPEEGLYDPNTNTITIFITSSHYELVHTLAHELGHALGMNHVQGLKSIMYTSTSTSLIPSTEDTAELTYVCRERTTLEWLRDKVIFYIQEHKQS